MKDQSYKKPNKTLLKVGKTLNKLVKTHMIQQPKKLVTQEQTFKKQLEKKLRKWEKYCNKKAVPYKRMLDYLLKNTFIIYLKYQKQIKLLNIHNY